MKKAEIVEREKMEKLIEELEAHPMTVKFREDRASENLLKRREATERIEALRKEESVVLAKLQAVLEKKKAKYREAKAMEEAAAEEVRATTATLRRQRIDFSNAIGNCHVALFESADPAIDEAITFFRDKLDFLRSPGRISHNAVGAARNIFTMKKTVTTESNVGAIHSAMEYCKGAIMQLENMKLAPVLNVDRIESLKKGIPDINEMRESTGEKPLPRVNADPRSLLPSDSQMEWEIGKLNEKFKKLMKK